MLSRHDVVSHDRASRAPSLRLAHASQRFEEASRHVGMLGGIGGRCGSGWGSCGVLARKGYSVHEAQSTMPERFVFSCTLFLACHMLLSSCVRKTPSFLLWRGAVLGQEGSEDIAATS